MLNANAYESRREALLPSNAYALIVMDSRDALGVRCLCALELELTL